MFTTSFKERFNELQEVNQVGINSVKLEVLLKKFGFAVTRKTISGFVKAGLVAKPEETNEATGVGRRLLFSYESALDVLVNCMLLEIVNGLGKGNSPFDKLEVLRTAKGIAELGSSKDVEQFVSYANIAAMIDASTIVPKSLSLPNKLAIASNARELLYTVAVLYKFLNLWIKAEEQAILGYWEKLRPRTIKSLRKKAAKVFEHRKDSNGNKALAKEIDRHLKLMSEPRYADAMRAWLEIIIQFENGSGLVLDEAHEFMHRSYKVDAFKGESIGKDWFVALSLL